MKSIIKYFFFVLSISVASKAKASIEESSHLISDYNTNDSVIGTKSNILIFKMINSPLPTDTPVNSNATGILKKAGKLARTSYSHTSIETILLKKKGI